MTLKINKNFKFLKSKIQQIFKKKKKETSKLSQIYTHTHTYKYIRTFMLR